MNLHFDPLDLDPPGVSGLVQGDLHVVGDALPLGQDVPQVLRTQHVPASLYKGIVQRDLQIKFFGVSFLLEFKMRLKNI